MKFSLIIILFLFYSKLSFGQNVSKCGLLKNIFADKYAKETFSFQQSYRDSPTIVFIDTANFFKDCTYEKINERSVRITQDTSYVNQANRYAVIVFVYYKEYNKYKLEFYSKKRHTDCQVELKKRKDKFKILKIYCSIID